MGPIWSLLGLRRPKKRPPPSIYTQERKMYIKMHWKAPVDAYVVYYDVINLGGGLLGGGAAFVYK